ncbi:hypothetical protein CTI12_AA389610 [Artemisia annua]|uniref:Uncharacterized protein n=1 Tax=Artemisia annua TaxID=35608 RepID=A0A2U1MEE1_ARTAN|nr:hypothetical protein CTI12_AA389610 [Artemisia annua]
MGLSFTKLFSLVFPNKKIGIVMVGLGAPGKTTILCKLNKLGKVVPGMPTIGIPSFPPYYKRNF